MLRAQGSAPAELAHAVRLGERLSYELLASGAQRLIAEVRGVGNQVAAP